MKKRSYFVSYFYTKDNKIGTGSLECECEKIVNYKSLERIAEELKAMNRFETITIMNWKPFEC